MRLERLSLLAFGPFTDHHLDLHATGVLHLVYGPNEAGKSSLLRALRGLLFGIPVRTTDGHLHPMTSLKVGASLVDASGRTHHVVRYKRNKAPLVDHEGQPVDALIWQRQVLQGLADETHGRLFGLDEAGLRNGAEALLLSEGNAGTSVFDAALGGGTQAALDGLRAELSALLSARGKSKLRDALARFEQADGEVAQRIVKYQRWQEQQHAREHVEQQLEELRRRQSDAEREQRRLERVRRARLPLSSYREAQQRLAELRPLTPLPAEFSRRKGELHRRLTDARREQARLEGDIAVRRQHATRAPDPIVELGRAGEDQLAQRLYQYAERAEQLPVLHRRLEQLRSEALDVLQRLGAPASLAEARSALLSDPVKAALSQLVAEGEAVTAALEQARGTLASRRAACLDAPSTEGVDRAKLGEQLTAARRHGNLEERAAEAQRRVEATRRKARASLQALGHWTGSLSELRTAPLPSRATCQRFEEELSQQQQRQTRLEQEQAGARAALSDALGVQAKLAHEREVPTEEQLVAARRARDERWTTLRAESLQAPLTEAALQPFESALREADTLADRLRSEAARVQELARARAAEDTARRRLVELEDQRAELQRERATLEEAWREAWRSARLEPASPREMLAWLEHKDKLELLGGQLDDEEASHAALEHELRTARAALGSALGRADLDRSLEQLIVQAEGMVVALQELGTLREAEALLQAAEQRHLAWQRRWGEQLRPLGLDEHALTGHVREALRLQTELAQHLAALAALEPQLELLEAEQRATEQEVAGWVARYAPDLSGVATTSAGEALKLRLREAQQVQGAHARALDELKQLEALRDSNDGELRVARQGLRQLALEVELPLPEQLDPAAEQALLRALDALEERDTQAQRLRQRAEELRHQLEDLGEGFGLEELSREVEAQSPDEAAQRLVELERELSDHKRRLEERSQELGRLQSEAASLEAGDVEPAVVARESSATEVSELVERYVRARIAYRVLQQEIERFRAAHQAPLLERVSALLRELTCGAFTRVSVRTSEDTGELTLHCQRASGPPLGVKALSTGTRDQLYLALRLAALEHHVARLGPFPVTLDDVLVQFDDERTSAALRVLGALAASGVQVLYFTHHQGLVKLAERTLSPAQLVVHQLPERSAATTHPE